MKTDVQDQELESSTSSENDVAAGEDIAEKAAEAVSSPAETSVAPEKDTLSIVRDVVDAKAPKTEPASQADGVETGAKPADTALKPPDDENYSDVPFHKHPRFQQLLSQTKTFKEDAGRYRNVQTFLDQHGVAAEEAAEALQIAALSKTNPREAFQRARPWMQALLVASGELLPADLQQQVEQGRLTNEAAYEVSRARAQVTSVQQHRAFEQERAQRQQVESHVSGIRGAADEWEADRRMKDPNFDAKRESLVNQIAILQFREGKPGTADGVRDQLRRAYDEANKSFRPPAPVNAVPVNGYVRRPPVRPVTGGSVSGNTQAKPESTLDIVRANRRTAG